MASKADRGTKRTCQNSACGARFYDLNRDPITCPMCSSPYVAAAAPQIASGEGEERLRRAAAKKPAGPAPVEAEGAELPAAEGDEALAAAAEGEEEVATEGDETFLEEEEDEGGDVTGIIGGVGEGEEEA